ncbi:CHAT domain-containing protein [Bradyrhizobium sp. USDA 3311]
MTSRAGASFFQRAGAVGVECLEAMLSAYELEHLQRGEPDEPNEQHLIEVLDHEARTKGRLTDAYAQACAGLGFLQINRGKAVAGLERIGEALRIFRELHSSGHEDTSSCSQRLAAVTQQVVQHLLGNGNSALAETCLRTALPPLREVGKTPELAAILNMLARMLRDRGALSDAEQLYREGITVIEEVYGNAHPIMASTLSNMGMLYLERPDVRSAIRFFERALSILRGAQRHQPSEMAVVLHNLAGACRRDDDPDSAERYLREAMSLIDRIDKRNPVIGEVLAALDRLLFDLGRFSEAAVVCENLVAHDDIAGNSADARAEHQQNLGVLYRILGRYREAEQPLLRATEILNSLGSGYRRKYARALCELSMLWLRTGDYSRADIGFHDALKVYEMISAPSADRVLALNGLASLREAVEDYGAARRYYVEALREVQGSDEGRSFSGTILSNLAQLEQKDGNFQRAKELFEQAVAFRERRRGESAVGFATLLMNFGNLYEVMGGQAAMRHEPGEPFYAEAEQHYRRAMQILEGSRETNSRAWSQALRSLGWISYVRGDAEAAIAYYDQAMPKGAHVDSAYSAVDLKTQENLATFLAVVGRTADAMQLMLEGADRDDRILRHAFSLTSERQRIAIADRCRAELYGFLSLLVRDPSLPGGAARGLEMVLRRKGIVTEAGLLQRSLPLEGLNEETRASVEELRHLSSELARQALQVGSVDYPIEALTELERRHETLSLEVARLFPKLEFERRLGQAKVTELANALPENSVLVEFVRAPILSFDALPSRGDRRWSADRYFAFVLLAASEEPVLMDLGNAEPVDLYIEKHRRAIMGESRAAVRSTSAQFDTGLALRRILFDPLKEALRGSTRVIIAPDSNLNTLAFEVLPGEKAGYLVDEYDFSYVSVGRDLLRPATEGLAQQPFVLANPDFDLGSPGASKEPDGRRSSVFDQEFAPLPGTEAEGRAVAESLGVIPLMGDAALKTKLKEARSPLILHLATHGFFLPDQASGDSDPSKQTARLENPMLRSGLALAGANWRAKGFLPPIEAEDGLLTAEDAAALDLSHTELVVLSACDTGLGAINSEGVFGLRRAFMLAGARTLLISLWKVPDQPTAELFAAYYRHLLRGKGRSESLREARAEIRQRWPHPSCWGAFICQGDWGAIPQFRERNVTKSL